MSGSVNIPLSMTAAGAIPTPPSSLRSTITSTAQGISPGLTVLPGGLIDDLSGTATGAAVQLDQARVDAINSVSPLGANAFILTQMGAQFGLPQGLSTNGSVYVVFSGPSGYVIPPGFVVSDGTNQYVIQDSGTISTIGTSQQLLAIATNSNSFVIPAGSVTTIVTSVPSGYTLTVTNPQAGVTALPAETVAQYRSRILAACGVTVAGTPTYLKTLLNALPGVNSRLVSVRQASMAYEVICGGGDPYQVAGAIYSATGHISMLTGSTITSRNITVSIYDAPDTYTVVYVNPPQQVVTVAVTWNTTLANFTASTLVNQYIITAVQGYINSIYVGQPINLMVMTETIQEAISGVLSNVNLTTLEFAVTINGTGVSPTAGTSIIPSDPESYFQVSATGVTSVQG